MWLAFAQSTARFTLGNNNNNAGSAAKQDLLQYRQQTSSAACDHTRHEVPVVLHWLVPCARISWVMRHSKCVLSSWKACTTKLHRRTAHQCKCMAARGKTWQQIPPTGAHKWSKTSLPRGYKQVQTLHAINTELRLQVCLMGRKTAAWFMKYTIAVLRPRMDALLSRDRRNILARIPQLRRAKFAICRHRWCRSEFGR